MNYSEMTVKDLRGIAREKGAKGAGMLTWSKVELIAFIENGTEPVRVTGVPGAEGVKVGTDADEALRILRELLGGGGAVDEAKVVDLIKKHTVKTIKVDMVNIGEFDAGVQHEMYERLLKVARISRAGKRKNVMLIGPAGSGKTHVCGAIAGALGIDFRFISVGQQTTKSDLIGYMDANGKYVATPLYHAFKDGGLFLLDEVDAGNANVLVILNALTANGEYTFPNGEKVKRHPDFICFAAANTYGLGQSRQYVGRNQLDAATRDRFLFIDFNYDEGLERILAGDTPVTRRIQRIRAAAFTLGEKIVVSPRASMDANDLVAAGFTVEEALDMALWKGVDAAVRERVNVK